MKNKFTIGNEYYIFWFENNEVCHIKNKLTHKKYCYIDDGETALEAEYLKFKHKIEYSSSCFINTNQNYLVFLTLNKTRNTDQGYVYIKEKFYYQAFVNSIEPVFKRLNKIDYIKSI
jgi:hypothetical protein